METTEERDKLLNDLNGNKFRIPFILILTLHNQLYYNNGGYPEFKLIETHPRLRKGLGF